MPIELPDASSQVGKLMREMYFPTSIYFRDLPDSVELNEAIGTHIYAWRSQDEEGIVRSNVTQVGSWHSNLDMHQREEYDALTGQVIATAQEIFDDLGYDPAYEPAFSNMWANINPKYGYNRNHIHPNALWSGVYYVQTPPDSGRIFFSDPRAQAQVLTPCYAPETSRRSEAWNEVYFEPIEGRVILFPAWLVHEVEPNMSDREGPTGDRISVSFNLYQQQRQAT
ncbi:MAG: TIGR02466 family protein [Gammaproteobacteria bacterium]|nr:TIGR02466 family protein [Gammaproteobacteria bacterium]